MTTTLSAAMRTLMRCAAVSGLILICASALAQPRTGLSLEANALFNRWMNSACLADEAPALTDQLRRYGTELAPAFQRVISQGPTAEELRAVRAAAEARYAERAKFPIEQYRIEGVTAQDLARFRRTSRQSYVAEEVRRYTTGYRSNAVAGLGIVGGPQARALLTRMAARKDDPLALAAAEALKSLGRR